MRGWRSLLILVVLALGLGGYIYFVESKRELGVEAKKEKVFAVEPGKVNELEVHAASGETTALKKTGSDWQIVMPAGMSADQGTAGAMASALETMEIQTTLDEHPASFSPFGLEPARFSVTFKAAGDATTHRLELGNKTPTGSELYARADGQPKLLLVASFIEESLNKTTFDFRDKTALVFDRDKVDSVLLTAAGAPGISIVKKDGSTWRVTAPIDARADGSAVDGTIGVIATAMMTGIVAGESAPVTPQELSKFGFSRPPFTITFGAGSARASLVFGAKKDDKTYYARDASKPVIFTVQSTLFDDVRKKADDFRVRDIFEFKAFSATSVELTHGGIIWAFAKSNPAGGDASAAEVWNQTKPQAHGVNQTAMTDLLNTISSMRAESFVERPAASGDDLVVVARYGDAAAPSQEQVTLRKSGDAVHAIRPGDTGAAVVVTGDFDKALTQLKAVTDAK